MRILCVIPVRGGSKGLPRKNALEIYKGKSLLEWTISQANMFPYSGTIVTLSLVGLIAGGLERPDSRNRSELLGTFQLPQGIGLLESSTATAFGR